jgi:hypothetical protein
MTSTPDPVSSPEATGGAGGRFETRVAAICLSRLLRGDRDAGLGAPVEKVGLQQRAMGAVLDDVTLEATTPLGIERSIEYQVKRRISPAPSDSDFVEVIGQCIDAVEVDATDGPLSRGARRLGLVSTPSGPLADLARVTDIARSHVDPTSFVQAIQVATNAGVRQRYEQLCTVVEQKLAADEEALAPQPSDARVDQVVWQVARCLYVWQVDAEPNGADVSAAIDRLNDLTQGRGDASEVFVRLIEASEEWATQAAVIDQPMLRQRLEGVGIALDAEPARRAAFAHLAAVGTRLTDPSVARIGQTVRLARQALREEVASTLEQNDIVIVTGVAGIGKSVLGRLVAHDVGSTGDVACALTLQGRTGTIANVNAELGVDLREGLLGAPIGATRLLLIDGAEQCQSDGGTLLASILAAIPRNGGSAPPWKVLLVTRQEAVSSVRRFVDEAHLGEAACVVVGDLTDAEVQEITDAFPGLLAISRNPRAKSLLLRRPFLADLLTRALGATAGPTGGLVGEEDLVDLVSEAIIRRDGGARPGLGDPEERADIYLELAERALSDELPIGLSGTSGTARAGLESDDVIRRRQQRWQFSHDVLADIAIATRLLESDGDAQLANAPHPRRLLRAVRLRMQVQLRQALAGGELHQRWIALLAEAEQLAARDGSRWADVPWEAILNLGVAPEALRALELNLLADHGAGVARLIDIAGRLGRVRTGENVESPHLDLTLTAPLIDLLIELGTRLPAPVRPAAVQLLSTYLLNAFERDGDATSRLRSAPAAPGAVVGWISDHEYGETLRDGLLALGLLGTELEAEHEDFIANRGVIAHADIAALVERPLVSLALARQRPEFLLRLAGIYYLGVGLTLDGETGEHSERPVRGRYSPPAPCDEDEEDGVRDHDPRESQHLPMFPLGNNQSNPRLGPFAALLEHAPEHGLRLVSAVVERGSQARGRQELSWGHPPLEIELALGDPLGTRTYRGPSSVWGWYRRMGTGSGPATSALMALREWGVRQVDSGRTLAESRNVILGLGESLALPAVALSVLVDQLDRVADEVDPFLVEPLVWHLETSRVTQEGSITTLDVPGATRLRWTMSMVVMQLVLGGDAERRATLAALAEELASRGGMPRDPVVERWARELDFENYRGEPSEQGWLVHVDLGDDLTARLHSSGGAEARQNLLASNLLFRAVALRDNEGDLETAAPLWLQVTSFGFPTDQPLHPRADVICAAAAALITAAVSGVPILDGDLAEALRALLDMGNTIPRVAERRLETTASDEPSSPVPMHDLLGAGNPGLAWDFGADRSSATALSSLLQHPDVLARTGQPLNTVLVRLEVLAASAFYEVRDRIASGLDACWALPCDEGDHLHAGVEQIARTLLGSSGLGEADKHGSLIAVRLAEPLESSLDAGREHLLDLGAAAYAIPVLAAARTGTCRHAAEADSLLRALLTFDQAVWPTQYAGHHYYQSEVWRRAVDRAVAVRILDGEAALLDQYIESFRDVPEDLRGLLEALVELTDTPERAERLHGAWSQVLDQLLPAFRQPSDSSRSSHYRQVEELDSALLLVPPPDATYWPLRETVALGVQWLRAFADCPEQADRAILFVARLGLLDAEVAVVLVLDVVGTDVRRIRRSSSMTVSLLRSILEGSLPDTMKARARALLDDLALNGHEAALQLQSDLEA